MQVVQERWGSPSGLTASNAAVPARAHLRAIKIDKKDYLKDVSVCHHEMRKPKVQDSVLGKRKSHQHMVAEGAGIISAAVSGLNKFSNDGSFMQDFVSKMSNNFDGPLLERSAEVKNEMSANQLAAKAMQRLLKGKHEEAEKLMVKHKIIRWCLF
ncbi:hypothetical protein LR48_Vigan609s003300 [Vigna angularis]|uniref:Uncharacterized protein n=1 Tax=Phaseolus angularis TaxID=3914 RepID=A0A0L9TER8_PHAAN|nr:hypothetical protein LR48_Vigan609s003300 [Vigna angularis]